MRPLASSEPLRTCGCRRSGRAPAARRAEPAAASRSRRSPLTLLCHCPRSTFPFLQTAPVRTNFPSEVAFCCLLLFFRSLCSPFPCLFSFLLCNNHNSNRRAPPKTRAGRASWGQRLRGAPPEGRARPLGEARDWSGGAKEKLKSSGGERLNAGSRARERLNVEFSLGTTCQQKRRLKTRAGAIYRHPRHRGRGAALASHCSICSAHPTQGEFGITLTMWDFFFAPPTPSAHG